MLTATTVARTWTDHPRVRGEHDRARAAFVRGYGSRPACAGNTPSGAGHQSTRADHPRVRGEHGVAVGAAQGCVGSPPRARGTRRVSWNADGDVRITPACAGNTVSSRRRSTSTPDHPRVRGEHVGVFLPVDATCGSPPRARGTRRRRSVGVPQRRITPACAGNTSRRPCSRWVARDHPRVRGEHHDRGRWERPDPGSPPRARGTLDRALGER